MSKLAPADRTPFFEIATDGDKWHWVLWSGNGRQMATNSIPYDKRKDCLGAIKAFKETIVAAKTVVIAHVG